MSDTEQRLISLEAELAELREQLSTQSSPRPTTNSQGAQPPTVAETVNRRSLLRKSGVAIAGAAAGGLAFAGTQASPAGAANGDPVMQGQTNTYTNETTLYSTSANQALTVQGRSNILSDASSGPAPLRLATQTHSSGKPAANWGDTGSLASLARNSGAYLWYCHAGPDKAAGQEVWGRVHTSATGNYTQLLATPERLVNTRSSAKPNDNTTNTFTLAGAPTDAVGFIGTITVTDTTSPGSYVSVYNGNLATIASPQFSHVNAGLGDTLATGLTVPLGAAKSIKVYVFKSCNVLIDVSAWIRTGDQV